MATYGNEQNPIYEFDIPLLKDQIKRDLFEGNETPTRIVLLSVSGSIDPFTEEVTSFETTTYLNASGVIGQIAENDSLLGVSMSTNLGSEGRIKVGDVSVLYHFDTLSGLLTQNNQLNQIEVLTPIVSGLYHVVGQVTETYASQPMYIKVALALDRNG